ncbi:MAG: 1-deoxy-D-xylulose-5-phosphate reductoisomerase [Candidatus Omnitrophota bacterium]
MKLIRVAILGSTGSIGINALKVIERFPERFKVTALTAYNNFGLLEKQVRKFAPSHVAVGSSGRKYFKKHLNLKKVKLYDADEQISEIAALKEVDIVVLAIRGSAALLPFLSAAQAGKRIAPANKEALVIAGGLIVKEVKKYGASIIPIDSEQSAIFQCLQGRGKNELKKIYLTASGGPLCDIKKNRFSRLSVREVLRHPRWKMGKKITVDSATLMNKGFEVLEARWLFDVDVKNIDVVVHPEAVIHSMVEFNDGSILAQLGITDMRLPIQYALTYPDRLASGLKQIDFFKLAKLTFKKPDLNKFPALSLAFYAAKKGETYPCALNAANEEAVDAFLNGYLNFSKIYGVVEKVVLAHRPVKDPGLHDINLADQWARDKARTLIFSGRSQARKNS